MPTVRDRSNSSSAFISCSTYSGLEQDLVQFEYLPVLTEKHSSTSTYSTSSSLLQQTSMICRSQDNEADTCESSGTKMSQEQQQLDNSTQQSTEDARTAAGVDEEPQENARKTPVRAKRKKRSKKHEMDFSKRMLKGKRQCALIQEYKSKHALLMKLVKQQQKAPITTKKDRLRCQQLIKKIRKVFALLRKMLRKRDRLQRILLRKRLYRERQRKRHLKLRKIMRVVYFKRQQRIRNMRNLRSRESNRLANNLMLQAAKLRARANRLTGGREVKHNQRKLKKTSKIQEQAKEVVDLRPVEAAAGDSENIKNSKIHIKTSMQQVSGLESVGEMRKKRRSKKHKQKGADKHVKRTKHLDGKLNGLNMLMEGLLSRLSNIGKNPKQKKRKHGKRKTRPAWWRRDRLRAAKIKAL